MVCSYSLSDMTAFVLFIILSMQNYMRFKDNQSKLAVSPKLHNQYYAQYLINFF